MKKSLLSRPQYIFSKFVIGCFIIGTFILSGVATVFAQSESIELVQNLTGNIFGEDDIKSYSLENLLQGDKVYVHVQGTSGNLDPFVALLSTDQLDGSKSGEFNEEVVNLAYKGLILICFHGHLFVT